MPRVNTVEQNIKTYYIKRRTTSLKKTGRKRSILDRNRETGLEQTGIYP
jgi:hypothetical protein